MARTGHLERPVSPDMPRPPSDRIRALSYRKALAAAGFRRVWEGDLVSSDPSHRGPSFI